MWKHGKKGGREDMKGAKRKAGKQGGKDVEKGMWREARKQATRQGGRQDSCEGHKGNMGGGREEGM